MSASNSPVSALPSAGDPSMEDILASIRRILNEDEAAAAEGPAPPAPAPAKPQGEEDGVLVLDNSMMVEPPAATPEPALASIPVAPPLEPPMARSTAGDGLLAPESEAAAAASVGTLLRTLTAERTTLTHSGGPTIEDLVREGIRPLLKSWLDVHLPPLVERLVRAEIDRVSGRASM